MSKNINGFCPFFNEGAFFTPTAFEPAVGRVTGTALLGATYLKESCVIRGSGFGMTRPGSLITIRETSQIKTLKDALVI